MNVDVYNRKPPKTITINHTDNMPVGCGDRVHELERGVIILPHFDSQNRKCGFCFSCSPGGELHFN